MHDNRMAPLRGSFNSDVEDLMNATRPCSTPSRKPAVLRWTLSATAAAVLIACGGGGGGEPTEPANQAPTVAINGPAASATFTAGTTINFTVAAADADGTVVRVEFYDGITKIGESTTAPFSFAWTGAAVGAHTVTARAVDNTGAVATSGTVALTVNAVPVNQPPTVGMTAPTTGFKPNAPATFTLAANAADTDGTVAKVEFFKINAAAPVFDASTLVGAGTAVGTPPSYQLPTTQAAGTYTFVARATDDKGATATSGSVQVIVNALPTVSLTAPTAGSNVTAGTNVTLRAVASDADGSIAKVEFFIDGSATPLGQGTRVGTTNEYTLAWNNVPAGAHTIVVRATDNDNAVQNTASVSVNGAANVLPTVTLDNPAAGANAPTTLNLSAAASDTDGTVSSVQFFNNGVLLGAGTLAAGKYTLAVPVSNAQAGTFVITARATDNLGGQTTTASKSITIAPNVAPAVSITSPAAVTLDAGNQPKTLTLTATASDTDGITKVEFFNGATKLGEATAAPYQITWPGVVAGAYSITAKATDTVGSTATTPAQALTVTPNIVGAWSTLNAAQKAGLALVPNKVIDADAAVDAAEVLTAIGADTVEPGFSVSMSQAARRTADLPLAVVGGGTGTYVACADGGTTLVQPISATVNFITYKDCKIGGYTLLGGPGVTTLVGGVEQAGYPHVWQPPTVPPAPPPPLATRYVQSEVIYTQLAANRFSIVLKGPKVTGNGTPEEGLEFAPRNAFGWAYVECTVVGATKNCFTNLSNTFFWGFDLSWSGWNDNGTVYPTTPFNLYATDDPYLVNGTVRICEVSPLELNQTAAFCQTAATAPPSRHIKFDNMTRTSGRAVIYGSNGWSVVTRLAPDTSGGAGVAPVARVQVQQTIDGVTTAPRTYRCPVGGSAAYVCTQTP
jgi:hypothetical protein